jgi:hypothetical protein
VTREELLLERCRIWSRPLEPEARRKWIENHGLPALLPDLYGEREARDWARRNLSENLLVQAAAERLVEALKEAGLRVAVLKGLDLIDRIYWQRTAVRRTSDVDLLVDDRRLDEVLEVVRSLGYVHSEVEPEAAQRRWSHQITYETDPDVHLEVHRLLSQDMGFTRNWEELERAGQIEEGAGLAGADRLTLEALLVHLLVHLAAHRFADSLRWVLDVLVILDLHERELSGPRLVEVARQLRGHRAAGAAVAAIAELVPGVDLGPAAALSVGGLRERISLRLVDPEQVARLGEAGWSKGRSFLSRMLLGAGPGATVSLVARKALLGRGRRSPG